MARRDGYAYGRRITRPPGARAAAVGAGAAVGALALLLATAPARAGGGPLNVLVVHNADDPEAVAVADHYAAARSLPAGHLCGLGGIDPAARTITFADYDALVRGPVDACLAALPYGGDVDYLVLVRGLPYRVDLGMNAYLTSLEAILQVLRAVRPADGAELAGQPQAFNASISFFAASIPNPAYLTSPFVGGDFTVSNPYAAWYTAASGISRAPSLPSSFRRANAGAEDGWDFAGNLFVVGRLDGFDYQDAHDLIDRAVAADGSFPSAEILCMAGADEARAARDPECEYVTRLLEMAGFGASWLAPHDPALAGHDLAAYFTGAADLRGAIAGNSYAPGAIACNLTSVGATPDDFFCDASGAVCPEVEPQTSIARFVRAGATGAHGCVAEPLNNVFPNAGALLLYTFGYNLGESLFFVQQFLYWQNLYLGDPLVTPFAERPVVTFEPGASVPSGGMITVAATHPDGVAQLALFVDGVRVYQQLTDTIVYAVDAAPGTTLELMAIAVAANAPAPRPGWPNPDQMPQPDVQGWATATIAVSAPMPGSDAGAGDGGIGPDAGDGDPPRGCRCAAVASRGASGGGGGGVAAGLPAGLCLAGLLLVRRYGRVGRRGRGA